MTCLTEIFNFLDIGYKWGVRRVSTFLNGIKAEFGLDDTEAEKVFAAWATARNFERYAAEEPRC